MSAIQELLERAAERHVFTCAAYCVGTPEGIIEQGYTGVLGLGRGAAGQDTLYDMASVTKPLVAMALMRLFEQGKFCLDDTVSDYLPEYAGGNKGDMTIFQLLTHTSVLHGQAPLFRSSHTRQDLLDAIRFLPPRDNSTVEYSSQGMIVLGEIMAAIEQKPLDQILEEQLFAPLGMADTRFNPPEEWARRIASTEDCPWRGHVVIGQVHDENAVVLGGVCGHAGIFSNTRDMAHVGEAMLTGCTPDGALYLHEATRELMTRNHTSGMNLARGLGWQGRDERNSPFGDLFSPESYGRTGLTGTGIWVDPRRNLYTVLLTNRVHPTREGNGIARVRRIFNNLAVLMAEDTRRSHG